MFTSLSGWGAHLLDLTASGARSEEESREHISVLEMRAVELALVSFLPQLAGQNIVLMSDNVSVVTYLCHQSSTVSRRLPDGVCHLPKDRAALDMVRGPLHSRQKEHSGGSTQSAGPGASSRAVPVTLCVRRNLLRLGSSPSGSLRHCGQRKAAALCFPDSGSFGLEAGRPSPPGGRGVSSISYRGSSLAPEGVVRGSSRGGTS